MLLFATITETAQGHTVQRKREIIEIDNLPHTNETIPESGANVDESLLPTDADDAEDIQIAKDVIEIKNNSTNISSSNVTVKTTTDVNNVIEQEFDGHHSHSNKTDAPRTVLIGTNSTDSDDTTKPSFTKDSSHVSHGSIENR